MPKLSDADLLQRLQDATTRREAFELMVRRYTRPLYQQIRRMGLTHDDTDDLLQNTFMKAWTGLDSFRGEAKLSTWLYRIAINESLTFLSKNKAVASLDDADAAHSAESIEGDRYFDATFDTLSMGMTHDYPIAIACGATMVRIGSKIFGARNYGPAAQ